MALRQDRAKPFLLWLAPPFLALSALISVAFVVVIALDGSQAYAQLGSQPISYMQFVAVVLPCGLMGGLLNAAAAYGLVAERHWAWALLTKWALAFKVLCLALIGAFTDANATALILEAGWSWVILAFSFWYFYVYWPANRYYERLTADAIAFR